MRNHVKPKWIILSVLAVALAVVIVLAGVHALQSLHKAQHQLRADVLAEEIVNQLGYQNQYTQVPSASIQKYYPIAAGMVESQGMWIAKTGGSADELCCFQLYRAADAEKMKAVIADRLEQKAKAFHGLNSDQYQQVQKAAVYQQDRYVLVAISSDPSGEVHLFHKLLK
ncbi:MAG: DUF4358 domain-containing protein [Oscillospiraceae bacterium]|uniref:DUF4358 domain-containing protein n=1 Tax=Caproicibacterium lactatifermentans TaxID=2666138 RepID=UPI001573D40C|nr:DUF4358 domain-containing protein [Caproicibacterium lactatifermentans]MDD4807697.1 DUF4358 domain-containing protein [Oscillospiraceae bacterium]